MRLLELLRLLRFGVVGLLAAVLHYWVVIGLVELLRIQPLQANFGGFAVAFWVSYFGHRYWTFANPDKTGVTTSFLRFLAIAVSGFSLNELLFYLFLRYLELSYYVALGIVVLIVAVMTYVLSRWWAFRLQPISHG
ncbi:MAG: GtrA family protein [Glaciimonas sp.]|nr:GtrA family protein [Glaciimonas sp.]